MFLLSVKVLFIFFTHFQPNGWSFFPQNLSDLNVLGTLNLCDINYKYNFYNLSSHIVCGIFRQNFLMQSNLPLIFTVLFSNHSKKILRDSFKFYPKICMISFFTFRLLRNLPLCMVWESTQFYLLGLANQSSTKKFFFLPFIWNVTFIM